MEYLIGVDIGGMSIKCGLFDMTGNILNKRIIKTTIDNGHQMALEIAELINEVILISKKDKKNILAIGVGSPGTIDTKAGKIVYANNLQAENLEIAKIVEKEVGLKVFVDNDANCAALGELYFGNAKGKKDVVLVTLGTGVGTGFIINGKLFTGGNSAGGEGGHISINFNGDKCNCGNIGCWESYASVTALIKQTKVAMDNDKNSLMHEIALNEHEINGKVAFNAVKRQDAKAIEIIDQYVKYVGVGLVNIGNIFRPEIILIGGGVSREEEYLIKPLKIYLNKHIYGAKFNPSIDVKAAKFRNDAGIIGAGCLYFDRK